MILEVIREAEENLIQWKGRDEEPLAEPDRPEFTRGIFQGNGLLKTLHCVAIYVHYFCHACIITWSASTH